MVRDVEKFFSAYVKCYTTALIFFFYVNMWFLDGNKNYLTAYQVPGLLLGRCFESYGRKLIPKILDPLFHDFLRHQICDQCKII